MAAGSDLRKGLSLGPFTVLPDRGEIIDAAGETRRAEPKVMAVLMCLAQARGELVTKQQLVDAVWDGRPVTDEVITRCISALRAHLGDDHKAPRFVETLPKRGYRLIAEVAPLDEAGASAAPRARRGWLTGLGLAVLLLATAVVWLMRDDVPPRPGDRIESIAILPFANMSSEDMQYLADGLTEELTYALALEPKLKVAARTTAFQFRDTALDVREIGSLIGVDSIIEGSVRREGERLRVTAQLVDTRSGYHLWVASFDGSIDEVFRLQRQVADRVRESIGSGEIGSRSPPVSEPADFMAYDLYLRGRYALQLRGLPALERAIAQFRESIALDPSFGPTYLELANALLLLPSYSGDYTEASYDEALAVVRAAVEADPAVADAAAAVSAYIATKRGQWLEADRAYRIALGAPQTSSTTHQWYSGMLASVGRLDDALAQARLARRLDPLSPVVVSRLAIMNLWADNDAAAARHFAVADELGIRTPLHTEGQLLLLVRRGEIDSARGLVREAGAGDVPAWLGLAMDCLERGEHCEEAGDELDRAGDVPPRVRLIAWSLLNRPERVRAVAGRLAADLDAFDPELLFIRELEAYRRDPEFMRLLEAVGILGYWEQTGCHWHEAGVECGGLPPAAAPDPVSPQAKSP